MPFAWATNVQRIEVAMQILGILNVTEDSFSDGGRFVAPEQALAQATVLFENGADIIDIGPASSHPDSKPVSPSTQIERLRPLLSSIQNLEQVSIDCTNVEVQRFVLGHSVGYLNDIRGFPEPEIYPLLAEVPARLIVMHSISRSEIAKRVSVSPDSIVNKVLEFFDRRVEKLVRAGISKNRLILDPGMGFFLGIDPLASVAMLRNLDVLRERFSLPILVSVSRKSFLQRLISQKASETQAATLAAELICFDAGVEYLRTHDPKQLRQGVQIWQICKATHND